MSDESLFAPYIIESNDALRFWADGHGRGLIAQRRDWLAETSQMECQYCLRLTQDRPGKAICVNCERLYGGININR